MPACHVTWLHISDAHFGAPDMAGELHNVIDMLIEDLQRMRSERELVPDFLFFTGDIAFGEMPGSHLADQYHAAQELLSKIEELCQIPRTNMFLVPGNHDVNRTRVDEPQTSWLDALLHGGADATLAVDQLWAKPENVSRDRYLERLENYAAFIQRAGLRHLLQDRHRLVYTHRRRVRGVDVAILDEFNVIGDKNGFATLIKELPQVKFVIVGTAVDVRLLVQEHASIPRQLAEGQIRLRPMSVEELLDLISNEEARSNSAFSFSAQAKRYVASAARGMPFFAHFLGRYSLEASCRDNTEHGTVKVELSHVQRALLERLTDLGDLETEYVRVVNGRWEREVLLKLLSTREEDTIPLINLRAAAEELGVRRLDSTIQGFVKNGLLERVSEAMYQFNDTRVRVYARLREPLTDEARRRWGHHESGRVTLA